MSIVRTAWKHVKTWAVIVDQTGHRWTVLPSYPRGVFRLWDRQGPYRGANAIVTPAPDDAVDMIMPSEESEVRELLGVELGAVEIYPPFTCWQDWQQHVTEYHDVPQISHQLHGHPNPEAALAWHRRLHAAQAGAPYALMSIPHTHEGL